MHEGPFRPDFYIRYQKTATKHQVLINFSEIEGEELEACLMINNMLKNALIKVITAYRREAVSAKRALGKGKALALGREPLSV